MTQQLIDIGVQGNDGTGDSIRTSFNKVNTNFTELYAIFGGGGTLKFTNLADAPASYAANQLIMADISGAGLSARTIRVGASTGTFSIDTTNPNEIVFNPPTSNLQSDQNPTLGGVLNAAGAYTIANLAEPSEALVAAFNANQVNSSANPPVTTTLDSLAVNVGYANKHYLQVSNGQILGALNVREEPLTPQIGADGYDVTLQGNYLSTEAVQRKHVVLRNGDTMTGVLTLSDHPTPLDGSGIVSSPSDLQAATKFYVDSSTYYSGVNLYVTTKGDDLQTNTPPGREGRHWQYGYATVGAAALQAENLIKLAAQEPGPYKQDIAYTVGPNQFLSTVNNASVSPYPGYRVGLTQGSVQVQGFTDVADLLQFNKSFIQAETIAYLNKKYINTFVFDQTRWSTFVGNIISAVAYDLALNTTYNTTTQASNFFYSYNADVINNNLTQIQDAVTQIRNQILNYSVDYNSNTALENYIGRLIYALSYDFAVGSNYQSTLAGLYFPYANNSLTTGVVTPDFSATEVVSLLDTTSISIVAAVGTGTVATVQFTQQAIAPFAVGEQVIIAGVSTGGYNSTSGNTGGLGYWTVTAATTSAVTFACSATGGGSGGTIVKNNLINNLINTINNTTITKSLQTNAALISEIVLTGEAPTPSFPASAYTTSGLTSAANLLLNNISFIQAEISGFLTSKFSTLDYNKVLSKRDLKLVIYSLVYDLTYGGNSQSTYAGVRYYDSVGSGYLGVGTQSSACIAALNYVATLASNIIANTAPTILYQNSIFQYTNETYLGGSAAASSINANIATIVGIIANGTGGYTFNTTNNTNIGVYGTAPTLPSSGNLLIGFGVVTNTTTGKVAALKTISNSYLASINGFISKALLGTLGDNPATQNTIYAKFNIVLNMLTYGLSVRSTPVYTLTQSSTAASAAVNVLLANLSNGYLPANINAYIINNNPTVSFNQTSSKRDVTYIIEALCYDLAYGGGSGNSAMASVASQFNYGGVSQLTLAERNSTNGYCYTAIQELENEIIALITNSSVTTYSGNSLTKATWQAGWSAASGMQTQIQNLFGLLLDAIANFSSATDTTIITNTNSYVIVYPSLNNATGTLFSTTRPFGAWNIITGAKSSITSYVINYLTTTYTGGASYNEALCYRDLGLIVDAITIDIVTGTPGVPATYQTINAGNSYYRNTSARRTISAPTVTPSVDGIAFAQQLASQVLKQTTQLRYQTTVIQNAYASKSNASNVQITGTRGQFSCDATSLAVGQTVTISGTKGGTGTITGYANPTTYVISETNGSTTFTLTNTTGSAVITTVGSPSGLAYTLGTAFFVDSLWTRLTVSDANFLAAYNQVQSSYTTILAIIQRGLSAAASPTFGSGFYSIQLTNGGQGSVDQGQITDGHIIPGKILLGNKSGAQGVILSYTQGGSLTYDTINVNMLQPGFFIPGETLSYAEAVSVGQVTIRVESGIYYEDYPIRMAANVTIKGDDFRRTIIRPYPRVSKSPWISLFFHRDGIFDGMQLGLINYSTDYTSSITSKVTLSSTIGNITATLGTGQVPASWNGLVLTEAVYTITGGTVATVQGIQYVTITFVAQPGSTMPATPYSTGSSVIISGMTPTTYNGTFTVSTCTVNAGTGTMVFANPAVSTLTAAGTANSATNYGNISTGKAVITSVSGNVMNMTVIYPFSTSGTFTATNWHLYTTIDYGRHYLTNPLDINSTPKKNNEVDVFLVNDATRISNISAQGHGGFMMVLDPEGQIKSKSPYGQESGSFSRSVNKKTFAGGQLIDGQAGRLAGTVVYVDNYPPNAVGLGYISGNKTLVITSLTAGTFSIGMTLSGAGISGTATITGLVTATGGLGSYTISTTQTTTGYPIPVTITGVNGTANTLITVQGVVNSGLDIRPPQAPCSFYLEGFRYQVDQVYDFHANVSIGTTTYSSGGTLGGFTLTLSSLTTSTGATISVGQYISGTGIPSNASPAVYITAIDQTTNTVTLSNTNFINGFVWTGLTAVPSNGATFTIGAPQSRLILDPTTPFTALTSYLTLQNSNSGGNYFKNILNAAVNDAMFGTNYQSARAGLIYIQTENVTSNLTTVLLKLGINYIGQLVKGKLGYSNSTATAISNNLAITYSIISNGITSLPSSITYPAPLAIYSGVTYNLQDAKNAANLLQINRAFIQQEVTAWLSTLTEFSLQTTTGWSPLAAQLNIGYIVDALTYDILYGGNSQTNDVSTKYFWWTDGTNYYNLLTTPAVANPNISTNAILSIYVSAFNYLQKVIANVVQGTTSGTTTTSVVNGAVVTSETKVYPSAGNGVGQKTTLLAAGTGSGGYAPAALVTQTNNIITLLSTYWTVSNSNRTNWVSYAGGNLTAITGPTITTSTVGATLSGNYTTLTANYTSGDNWLGTVIPNYLTSGNVPINIEMGGNKSMLANDYTQVNDLGYGIVATNAGLTEQVSTFTYYNHVGYWALNGGQIRSVAGSNGYGDYGLRATGADSTELPNAVNLVNDLVQTARVYKQGAYASAMTPTPSQVALNIYIIGYEYIPYSQSYVDIDHSAEGGTLTTYQLSGITHTSVTIGQNVLQLTVSTSTGLAYPLRDGQIVTIRTNTYVEFTNITNVKPVRPSTALQYNANLGAIYRVLSYNLSQATGEAMSTATNAVLQTANGFNYYTFTTDTGSLKNVDPVTIPSGLSALVTATVASYTLGTNTITVNNVVGTIAVGQSVGGAFGTSGVQAGQAIGYILPGGLTVTNVTGSGTFTITLSGTISTSVAPTGTLVFSTLTQGATAGDNKVAIAAITDVPSINQINTGIYALAWAGRTHQVLSYTSPLYASNGNVLTITGTGSSTQLTVNSVSGTIYAGQLITGTGVTAGTYVTSVITSGVFVGQSTLSYTVYVNQTMTTGSSPVGTPLQFGFNINGYLQISATPIYNNASVGTGVNGLAYQSSALQPGSTVAQIVTYTVPYSPTGSLPPVDSSLKIAGYSATTAITGYISTGTGSNSAGTVLTVVSVQSTGTEQVIFPGMVITGAGVGSNTTVISNITAGTTPIGTGSTWLVSVSQSAGYNSGSGTAFTLTGTAYNGTYQVTNVSNTTTISTTSTNSLAVGMVVSILQTTGYLSAISGSTLTITIASGPTAAYKGQIITFYSSFATSFAGITTSAVVSGSNTTYQSTPYYVVNPSAGVNQITITNTVANVATGSASSFSGGSGGVATFSATVSSAGLMTVTGSVTGTIQVGMMVFATGITSGTYISSNGSGSGGVGTYNLSSAQTVAITTATTITASFLSFTSSGGNVPTGTIIQSINALTNTFVVSPACWIPSGATIGCIQYAYVTKVNVVNSGGGYSSAPVLSFSGGGAGATQAIAAAQLKTDGTGQIQSVTVVNGGQGYTSAPSIAISAITGSVTGTTSGINQIIVNSTAGLSSGSLINFTGTAFASTVYNPSFFGYISSTTLYVTNLSVATLYVGMVLSSGGSITANTTITGSTSASFTGTFGLSGGTLLTVSAVSSGTITAGMILTGGTVGAGVYIVSNQSGSAYASGGGTSTWTVSATQPANTTATTGTTWTVGTSQTAGSSGSPLTIIGTVGGLSSSQTYTVSGIVGSTAITVYIYGSTTSPILGTTSNIATGALTFNVPGSAVLTAEISQYINTSVTTTGGASSTQLSVLYPSAPGVTGSISQTSTSGNLITISSASGTNGLTIGQQIIFTGTAFGTLTSGTTYYILTIPSTTTITVATSYYNYVSNVAFVPSSIAVSAGSMTFYCPNFVNQYAGTTASSYTTKSVSNNLYSITLALSSNINITQYAYYYVTNNSNGLYNGIWQTSSATSASAGAIVLTYPFDPGIWDSGALALSSGSVTSNVATVNFTTSQTSAPYQVGQKITIAGSSVSAYNGIWTVSTCTTSLVTFALVGTPGNLTNGTITSTTNITQLSASATGSAIGLGRPFSTTNTATLYAGYTANTNAQITQRISLCRATGHDFAFIGTGGYITSNYPTQIYGNPALPADGTKQVLEEGVGRCFYVTTDENGIFRVGTFFTVDQGTGTVSISQNIALTNVSGLQFQRGVLVTDFSSDAKMTENASDIIPVQSAIRSFIDYRLGLDYGGSIVPDNQLLGPGYVARSGQLSMTGQFNMGGYGIINMNMPVQAASTNATNKGYVDTALFNQNSLFKLADGTYLPFATSSTITWSGVGLSITATVSGTNLSNQGGGIVAGMAIYGGGSSTSNGITTYAFDGTHIVQYVSTTAVTSSAGTVITAAITLNKVPNFIPGGAAYFTTIVNGSQLVFDAPTGTYQVAQLAGVNNTSPLATTGVSTSSGTVTLTFATQTSVPFNVGQTIIVNGVTPVGYNGIYTVLATPTPTTSSVSFTNATTGAITTQGTIISNVIGKTYTRPVTATFQGYIQSNNLYIVSGTISGTISQGMILTGSTGTSANANSSGVINGTVIGSGSGLVWPVTAQSNVASSTNPIYMVASTGSYSLTTSVNSGTLVDSMINTAADIEQSKLLLNVPGASYTTTVRGATGTVIATITNGSTLATAPTGTRQQIQAANGLASFNSAIFDQTNGWVTLQTATSNATGIQPNKITYIPTATVLYNQTNAPASPTAVSVTTMITDGNAVTNDKFTTATTDGTALGPFLGVMTVKTQATGTNGAGTASISGYGNTYTVLQISNPAQNAHGVNSIIQSDTTGAIDVGSLKVQGYPIITTNSGNTNYQITFGFPGATTASNVATFSGYISGTSLTVTTIPAAGSSIMAGAIVTGSTVSTSPVTVVISGSGTAWTVYPSQTVGSAITPVSLTSTVSPSGTPGFMTSGVNAAGTITTQFFGQVYSAQILATTIGGAYAGLSTASPPTISSGNGTWTVSASNGFTLNALTPFNVGTAGGGGQPTNLYGSLAVVGNATFGSNMTMNGSVNADTEKFTITNGAGTPVTTFQIDSANGNTVLNGTLTVGAAGTQFTVDASGNTVVRGNLTVTGTTTEVKSLTVDNVETITQTLAVSSNLDIGDTGGPAVAITGGVTIGKQLQVGNTTTINGNTSITGAYTFTVGTGATALGGTLGVTGAASFNSSLSGTNTGTGAVNVTGSTVLNHNLTVIGGSGKNFKITSGGGSPVTTFNVDTNTGNTLLVNSATLNLAKIAANGGTGTPAYTGTVKGVWSLINDGLSSFDATNGTLYSTTLSAVNGTGSNGTITGNWTITGTTTLSSSLTLNGSTTANAKTFTITNGASPAITKFQVDSSTGNTTIVGSISSVTNVTATGYFAGTLRGDLRSSDGATLLVDATNNIVTANIDMAKASTGVLSLNRGGTGAATANGAAIAILNAVGGSPAQGMALTYNGASSYTWSYPANFTIPPSGTTINSSHLLYTSGVTSGQTFNGPSKFTTPVYVPNSNQLKVYVNGVRQDQDNDYSEDSSGAFMTFTEAKTDGDIILLEVDGYKALDLTAINTLYQASGNIPATKTGSLSTFTDVQSAITFLETDKFRVSGGSFTGNVTMGTGTKLTLAAGSTTVAPFVLISGPLLTTPVAGSVEYNAGNLYWTDAGSTRRTVASTSYVDTAVSNGTASAVAWTGVTGKPTTIAGYGITDAITTGNIGTQTVAGVPWSGVTGKPTTVAGFGITDAITTGNIGTQTVATAGALTAANAYTVERLTATNFITATNNITAAQFGAGGIAIVPINGIGSAGDIATNGRMTAAGDIIAYSSDRRLKENFRAITNAVEKVVSLNGVIYNWNSIANELAGYDRNVDVVGLIAQEVEAVLPEAVKLAPFDNDGTNNSKSGENYKTIQYEKVVPLLVEAIKEQQATIERQQAQIDALMKKLGM
jgi:hypothetical protein